MEITASETSSQVEEESQPEPKPYTAVFVKKLAAIGGGEYYDVFVDILCVDHVVRRFSERVAAIYPWYDEMSPVMHGHKITGYGWMVMPKATLVNIKRIIAYRDQQVETVEQAIEWCRWWLEEGTWQEETAT